MSKPFPNRALVTGATSGIGYATARLLAANGIEVGILAEDPAQVDCAVRDVRAEGGRAFPVYVDLSDREQTHGLIDRVEQQHGPIDLLVNNAGIGLQADVSDICDVDLRHLFDVNFFALVTLSRDAMQHMGKRGHGQIINVSSAAARRALPGLSVYASTKAAVHAFNQALRVEGRVAGVRVTEVLPMSVRTPFFQNAENRSGGAYEPGGFVITAEEVARRIFRSIRRPVPEVYTSTLSRFVLALDAMNPKWLDAILIARRRRSQEG